jgi:endonuclease YncB( thermonuclease family)
MRALVLLTGLFLVAPALAAADPCTAPLPQPGTRFSGSVRYVGDGDSLCVGRSGDPATWIEVRLADFYAPELSAPGGREAKAALEAIARGRAVACRAGRRSYDRVVAHCSLNGAALGDLMRSRGVVEGGRGR